MKDSITETLSMKSQNALPSPEEVIPHRAPMLFLSVVDRCGDSDIVGRYRFAPEDPIFKGHFPKRALVPGVLLLEGAAQTLAYWALRKAPDQLVLLTGVERAKWTCPIYPGQEVTYHVKVVKAKLGLVIADLTASVNEEVALTARIKGFLQSEHSSGSSLDDT